MPHLVLADEEIQTAKLKRECLDDSVQVYRRTYNNEPSEVEIRIHLEHWG